MRRVVYLAALVALTASVAGCDSLRQAAGLTKNPPDEFAVTTKAPLIIPPDFNLKPPKPGAAPTNQASPTEAAQGTLFGNSKMTSTAHGPLSPGEQALLAKAGATNASNMIRQRIAADNRAMQAADNSFTNQLLFGMGSDNSQGTPVNANAEARRLDKGQAGTTTGSPPPPANNNGASTQKDSGSWLDDILDGVF